MKKENKKELCELWKYTCKFIELNKYYIFWFCIFCLVFTLFFYFGQLSNPSLFNEYFGTFGDFIGGVLGTLFALISVAFMKNTFDSQREESRKNLEIMQQTLDYQRNESKEQRNDAAIQRFNNLFFELLRVYQEQVKELCIKGEDGKEYCGKEFFAKGIEKMKQEFDKSNKSYKNSAKKAYMTFYENNKSKLGAYFRTLFRIFDLIDNSILDTKQRKEYAKIIRAQLSENELFFIRYNAMTIYSSDDNRDYINKYNLLKHLPIFELVEFEKKCKKINITKEKNSESINAIYYDIRKTLKDILKKYNSNQYTLGTSKSIELSKYTKKHKLYITLKKEYEITFTYEMDENIKNTTHPNFIFLDNLKREQKTLLLKLFINEIFFDSNFSEFNKRFYGGKGVKIEENKPNSEAQIIISIINVDKPPLRLKKV